MIYIRTDVNNIIATGHVMRCLAIADTARQNGEDVTFLLADGEAAELLKEKGYAYIILGTDWKDMVSELSVLENIILERGIQRILIDSYQVTREYLERLQKCVEVIYLDDLNAFDYPVDALICYANYWEKFCYSERYLDTRLYLGMDYMPLREIFSGYGEKKISDRIENLLLMSGGTDSYDVLGRLLECLEREKYKQIDVICGAYNINYDNLCQKYSEEKNVHIHRAVTDMDRYMKEADLAVSAGGTTLYELCACGTPTISYALADNQLDNVRQFEADGIIAYAGDVRTEDVMTNVMHHMDVYEDKKIRQTVSEKMRELVDGHGAQRIVEILMEEK